jgi:hypothetical protein
MNAVIRQGLIAPAVTAALTFAAWNNAESDAPHA